MIIKATLNERRTATSRHLAMDVTRKKPTYSSRLPLTYHAAHRWWWSLLVGAWALNSQVTEIDAVRQSLQTFALCCIPAAFTAASQFRWIHRQQQHHSRACPFHYTALRSVGSAVWWPAICTWKRERRDPSLPQVPVSRDCHVAYSEVSESRRF